MLSNVRGIIPVLFDSNPHWIEVEKTSGVCREVLYMGYDWLFGEGKDYEDSIVWSDIKRVFDNRKGKGVGFSLHILSDEPYVTVSGK